MFREPLLQSSLWKAFQEKNGKHCLREQETLFVVETLPVVGQYLYAPRWPVLPISNFKFQISKLRDELVEVAQNQKASWIRVEPAEEIMLEELKTVFGASQIVRAPHDVQPREILVTDIGPDEAALLTAMKSKTRYNIRLAEKHGVTVRFSRSEADLETFINLIYATTDRKAIRPHGKEYYRNFFKAFDEAQCVIALAEHGGRVLAANLLVFFEGAAYYLHGGSSDEGRHLMAPYLLQWESIREAKRRGVSLYDFGGVRTQPPTPNLQPPTSSWAGITRFKQGFAPATPPIRFPGAYDIVVRPWRYQVYRFLWTLQQWKKKVW